MPLSPTSHLSRWNHVLPLLTVAALAWPVSAQALNEGRHLTFDPKPYTSTVGMLAGCSCMTAATSGEYDGISTDTNHLWCSAVQRHL